MNGAAIIFVQGGGEREREKFSIAQIASKFPFSDLDRYCDTRRLVQEIAHFTSGKTPAQRVLYILWIYTLINNAGVFKTLMGFTLFRAETLLLLRRLAEYRSHVQSARTTFCALINWYVLVSYITQSQSHALFPLCMVHLYICTWKPIAIYSSWASCITQDFKKVPFLLHAYSINAVLFPLIVAWLHNISCEPHVA